MTSRTLAPAVGRNRAFHPSKLGQAWWPAGRAPNSSLVESEAAGSQIRGRAVRGLLVAYIAAIYLRPGEIFPALQAIPIVAILGGLSVAGLAVSLLLRPRAVISAPELMALLFWVSAGISRIAFGPGLVVDSLMGLGPAILMFCMTSWAHESVAAIRFTLATWLAVTLVLAGSGIMQVLTGVGLGGVTPMGGRIRGSGIFNDPNDLGLALVMALPVAFGYVLEANRSFLVRLAGLASGFLLLVAIYYTNSRGSFLGAGVVVTLYTIRRWGIIRGVVPTLILGAALLAFAPSRVVGGSESDLESTELRIEAWFEGIQMFKASPLVGIGYANFQEYYAPLVAHNSYIHVMAEQGLLGLIGFLGVVLLSLRWASFSSSALARDNVLRLTLVTSALGSLVCVLVLSRHMTAYFYIPFGLCCAFGRATGRRVGLGDATAIAVAVPVVIVAMYLAVQTFG